MDERDFNEDDELWLQQLLDEEQQAYEISQWAEELDKAYESGFFKEQGDDKIRSK